MLSRAKTSVSWNSKYSLMPLFNFCYPYMINDNNEFCVYSKHKDSFSIWMEPKVVPGCIRTNLTTLRYSSNKETGYDMKFLKYMLANADVLKAVTITRGHLSLEEEMSLYTELLKFPKASMDCAIKRGSSRVFF